MENEEKKNEITDNEKTEEIKTQTEPEKKEEDSTLSSAEKPEQKPAEEASEEKTDASRQEEKAGETAKEERQQEVKAEPLKPKKKINGKAVGKVIGIAALAVLCGFGGGYWAGKISADKKIEAYEEEVQEERQEMPGRDFGGNMPGGFNEQGQGEVNTNSAALGVYVTEESDGVTIAGFTDNSNAETAGLKTGDIITKIDDTEVSSLADIREFLADKEAGDKVKVTVTRDGSEETVTVELVENSSSGQPFSNGQPDDSDNSNDSHDDFPDSSDSELQG